METTEKQELTLEQKAQLLEKIYDDMRSNDKLFLDAYLTSGFNATKAVQIAFPDKNFSPAYQRTKGYQMINHSEVAKYLEVYFDIKRETSQRKIDKLCEELEDIAFSEAKQYKDATLKMKALDILSKYYGMDKQNIDITSGGKELNIKIITV